MEIRIPGGEAGRKMTHDIYLYRSKNIMMDIIQTTVG